MLLLLLLRCCCVCTCAAALLLLLLLLLLLRRGGGGQGLLKAALVNKLTRAGCVFKFWVADWFAMLNNKMGGDLGKIRNVGKYMIEVWKACGMDMTNVRFLWYGRGRAHDNMGFRMGLGGRQG